MRVVVTPAGLERLRELHAVVHELDDELRGILTKRDVEVLTHALPRINAYFEQRALDDEETRRRCPMPVDDDVVIRTEQLTKVYPGGLKAVDELDLEVHQGEIFGLLGPNGAGKTTTAGMLTTRVIPTSGRAFVGGIDVVDASHRGEAGDRGGAAEQHARPLAHRVGEPLLPRPLLRDVGRRSRSARPTGCSSSSASPSGARRRSPRCRAAWRSASWWPGRSCTGPAILFLDEPTAGLDPQSRLALWEILGELHVDGQTILLTTHYMEEADELCNRLAIIDRGNLLALGTPAELKRSTGADTIVTVTATGDLDALAKVLEADVPGAEPGHARRRRPSSSRCRRRPGVLPLVFSVAERHGFDVSDLSVTEPTLETVFINLTGKDLRE